MKGREAAISVYAKPIATLGMTLTKNFRDEEECKEFTEKVQKEFMTSNYPMYVKL